MKVGIYMWHPKNETRYCIGEWDPSKPTYKGLSAEEGAKYRIKQEITSKTGTSRYTMDDVIIDYFGILDFNFTKKSGFDKEIHKNLVNFFGKSAQIKVAGVKSEFFQLDPKWKNHKAILKDAIIKTASNEWDSFNPERPHSFSPRTGSQNIAIKTITQACVNGVKQFLLGAKCRFGKTHTAYEIAKMLNFNTILIMTFRPSDTEDAWREDLISHQDFKNYYFFNQKELKEFSEFNGKKVLFMSFQKAKTAKKDVPKEFESIKKIDFDMLIIDEDQIGAHRVENRNLIDEVQKKFTLVCTGTPELEIMSNEFGDNYYKFDYIDEQKLKESADKAVAALYADMPRLTIYSLDIADKFAETIGDKNGFSLSEMFAVNASGDDFKYPKSINKFLDYISAESNDASYDIENEDLGIFANRKLNLNHGLWKLPSVKACRLLKDMLENHTFFSSYRIEVLPKDKDHPNDNKSPKEIEDICEKNKRTIWLTVMKNTVGVTVKPWTYTMSLYGSDNSSLTTYIQYIFRAGSPGKKEFYSFDFCPSRALDVVDSFAVARCADRTGKDYQKTLSDVINYLPVFAYKGSGQFVKMEPEELFKQISYLTSERACRNLLLKDFELLKEFKDDVADVDVDKSNPVISKNEALKKLKKELDKKQKESSGKKDNKEMSDKDFFNKMFQAFKDIYSWVKYSDGVEDLDDFVKKLENYKGSCEEFFGFSDDFIASLIAVINTSKRNFGIAIERFKNLPFKFAMEDVPEELAERMIKTLSYYREITGICDIYCCGPSLLKAAKKLCPKAKLYAYIPNGSRKIQRQLEIEIGNVNIIQSMKEASKLKIIMNPPYNGNLHLKILSKIIEECKGAEIVNLSPIRWLQDPLAEYKQNSDWKKFEDIRSHIESLDVVNAAEANKAFGINFGDLGVYHITDNGGWKNNINKTKSFVSKILQKAADKSIMNIATEEGWRGEYKGIFGVINSHYGDIEHFIKNDYRLFCEGRYTNTNKVLFFDTEEERQAMFSYLSSKLMNAFAKEVRINQRVPWQFVPVLPDYSRPWSNADLYNYFGLTPEEVEEIEKEIQ